MFINELFESKPKRIVAVLPGRFQPWHLGHKSGYDFLVKKFGAGNVFIITSNKVDPPKSPFSFEDKLAFITATGIDPHVVVQSTQPYRALEITSKLDPANTVMVFGVSAKDMAEDPRFSFAPKKDGSQSYFQPMPANIGACESLDKHGYIMTVPTIQFNVAGKPMRSASEFRANFVKSPPEVQKQMIQDMFGKYDKRLMQLLRTKLQ
jgi:hypothetical protein